MSITESSSRVDHWRLVVRGALWYVIAAQGLVLIHHFVMLARVYNDAWRNNVLFGGSMVMMSADYGARLVAIVSAALCLRGDRRAGRWLVLALVAIALVLFVSRAIYPVFMNGYQALGFVDIVTLGIGTLQGLLVPLGLAWFFRLPSVLGTLQTEERGFEILTRP